ncbi:S-DNA-T family DNA segregation ATPase FtsK/SpoIIIE [Aequitasia blattaphilus]|uniref:Type VII secretion protein EssC n=1 Tax=Aequitasia blattaphilus TaxID=2949332 RepID=A0ABT1EB73_9FIRM|nr:type VII secretion protein EssC [Aequitasia blattaphilus]MCP1103080.1 type VII secretion protein EssC [Aequitasia blattaphilus]MCR8615720.1 type VII secretion protein EssC [Aequitasia blattaphilus]
MMFERKQQMILSGNAKDPFVDILIPNGEEITLRIDGSYMELKREMMGILLHNQKPVTQERIQIQKGDEFLIAGLRFTFFADRIEIEGEGVKDIQTTLAPMPKEDGRFPEYPFYKRSPRVIHTITQDKIELKAPPRKQSMEKGGILTLLVPTLSTMAFTLLMGFMLKRGPYIYMSVGMTVITTIFSVQNFIKQRKEMKASNLRREEVYREYLLNTRKTIKEKRKKEEESFAYQYPRAKTIERMVEQYSSRLYERTPLEEDFLEVNLGFYKGESFVAVGYDNKELELEVDELSLEAKEVAKEYKAVPYLPLNVELGKSHLGLVGYKKNVHEQIKYLLLQLTFFHSYHDLQIIMIYHQRYQEEFSYLKWYPHLQIQSLNVTGEICKEQARDQIVGSIQQILKERKQKQEEEQAAVTFSPHFLFIIDEPSLIVNHTIMEYLQEKELNLGYSFIYTTDQQENLPENVKTLCFIENKEEGRLLLNQGEHVNQRFAIQHLEDIELEKMARRLSGIVHQQGMKSQIPESITFFDLYKIEHPYELEIQKRWESHQSHKSLSVPLGVRAKEDYVELNLHEKAHGPHGLVAGTTGSGKSEIVQSYILSLAANFHPYEVGFLLIDYKGGGMANLFSDLPHLLGTITNLDKAESMRAMVSIKAELSRRQKIFGEHNVNHINGYNQLFRLGEVKEPLPHLFLISDEFAELKKEQPEFMSELVSAARIGRSLGIHLILATQKPSGVVDDQIWTNSKFKLCLKVQNAGDSKEMLKTPDAANITQAGRAYLQVGNNEIYELFQSAWSGATYQKEASKEAKEDDRVYEINEIGQGELINQDLGGTRESNQMKETQLDAIVSHIHEVYQGMETVEVKKPWLPSLPGALLSPYTKEVRDSSSFNVLDLTLGIGRVDIPEEQDQREYFLDFEKQGHLLYMSSSGYGKSMFLGQIILGLAMKNAVQNLNMYILDLGNSALIPYKGLPHVADYMGFDDGEKLRKFQKMILDEMADRKRCLAKTMTQNFHVYNQSQEEKMKAIVILVDQYDVVSELGDEVVAFIQKVSRDGASLGIYLAVTMTRDNVMRGATKGNFKERIAGFNFVEGENFAFIGRSSISLQEEDKGRVLIKTDQIHQMQLYLAVPFTDELNYNEELKKKIEEVAQKSSEERAQEIATLPEVLTYDMLPRYPGYQKDADKIPVGIDAETLEVRYLDIQRGTGLLIGGQGMGRTNGIKNILNHLKDEKVYLFDARNEELREHEKYPKHLYGGTRREYETLFEEIAKEVEKREEHSLIEGTHQRESQYIVIDVIQEFMETIDDNEEIVQLFVSAMKCGIRLVASADAKLRARTNKVLTLLVESQGGLILGNIKEQSVFSYTGIREENRSVEWGYYSMRGENRKVKVIEHK